MGKISFGWRIPEFSVDGTKGAEFKNQILCSLDRLEGSFDSAWLCDHLMPGTDWQNPDVDNLKVGAQ